MNNFANVQIKGIGHVLGEKQVFNSEVSTRLGKPANFLEDHTGVITRQINSENQNIMTLAVGAVENCLRDANISSGDIGKETTLIYIQNGMTHITPPAGILLSKELGTPDARVLSLNGVCSEPIHAIEIGCNMIERGNCERVIICASADFIPLIDKSDINTAGLFGTGAGAFVLEKTPEGSASAIHSVHWETDSRYWDLGVVEMNSYHCHEDSWSMDFSYYQMQGTDLARVAYKKLRPMVKKVLQESDWDRDSLDHVVTHQPNVKMMEIALRYLKLPLDIVPLPGKDIGNMGPASVMVSLSLLHQKAAIKRGQKLLISSFGLGFSNGCATVTF